MKYNMVAILSYCCCYCCSVTAACSNSTSPWTAKHQTPHSSNISQSFLKFMSTESVMLPNHLILCSLLSFLPSVFPSIKVFSNEFTLHIRWSFNFSNSPFNEYSALISFKIYWFDLLAFQVWCWPRLLRIFWTARRSNQSLLKEVNPEYSLEVLMLKLKLQYFGHLMHRVELTHWERL